MKKIVAIACTVFMMATLSGCGTDYSNTTVVGQVTEVDGTKITLQLGEMAEMELPEGMEDMFGGEMPEMPDGRRGEMPQWGSGEMPEMPESGMGEFPEMPEGEMGEVPEMPQGEIPESSTEDSGDLQWGTQDGGGMPEMPQWGGGEMPELPSGEIGNMPEDFGDRSGMMQGGMFHFTASEETFTVDLEDTVISFGFGQMTMEGDISMISEGTILVIEYGDNNKILSVTVQVGGNRENMNMPKGSELAQPYS